MAENFNIMKGKRGLILGVANDRSIAWGIARFLHDHGAELAFTYQGEAFEKRVRPLAESVASPLVLPCDVEQRDDLASVFDAIGEKWGVLDFVVHSLAYSNKEELTGRYMDTSAENFSRTLHISCFSFTETARLARPLMAGHGGSLITLSYLGGERVVENYNVMGPVKAALEATVRYLAHELGPSNIRVNAISAGPVMTRAASGLTGFAGLLDATARVAPLRRNVTADEVGRAALLFASDYTGGITGEVLHVDAGVHVESPVAAAEMNSKSENSR